MAAAKLSIMDVGEEGLGGIELGLGRERLSRIGEMPLFLIFDLIEARFDLIYSHFDLILCIPT
ncbi:MAG: hypothetical protein ACQET8_23380 [Bacillota bacterium]